MSQSAPTGNIKGDVIIVHPSAVVEGSITYRRIHIKEEATVNGGMRRMEAAQVQQMTAPQYAEPTAMAR